MESVLTPTFRYIGANGEDLVVDDFAVVNASGELVEGAVATGLACIGTLTESATGDGATKLTVRLGGMVLADNDSTDAVAASHIGESCYLFNGHTVSSDSSGTSVAGKVLGFVGTKVLVKIG